MLLTLKNLTHHADIPAGDLRIIPSKGGKSWLIVAANGQAIAEMVPTQDTKKAMTRAALLSHALNRLPGLLEASKAMAEADRINRLDALQRFLPEITKAEDLSKIGI